MKIQSNVMNQLISREISTFSKYFDRVIAWQSFDADSSQLIENIDAKKKLSLLSVEEQSKFKETDHACSLILMNGVFNFHLDIQSLLEKIHPQMSRRSRILVIAYNPYLRWAYAMANKLGLRKGELPFTFVTNTDLANICKVSGFSVTKLRRCVYIPYRFFGLEKILNRIFLLIPIVRDLCISNLIMLRPIKCSKTLPSLSVLIPARNEKGNLENALRRMPLSLSPSLEILFIEGHSGDGTWEEIIRLQKLYSNQFKILAYQQLGKGKSDAVRLGFQMATGELITILDADLTMPPESLPRFYEAFTKGHGDFVNGNRLVYPMEGDAMKYLNRIGNRFFAKALSYVLDTQLGDSLCGTKLFLKKDYERILEWREDFGDFDPFGDFELLFPAAVLGLGLVEIPVRYRARTYGLTNIRRFRDGWLLLKMTAIGFFRIKF